ncbi:MAG: hypothetical protein Q8M15_12315 [Bacteroidota bacterium]|nr:hypothetical protein [Bacteroidota bacterium]
MGKTVVLILFMSTFFCCKKIKECPPDSVLPFNPNFVEWGKLYPSDSINYTRYKSNKGQEESLVSFGGNAPIVLKDNENDCTSMKGEFRRRDLSSTIYYKLFEIVFAQFSSTETRLTIINRCGILQEGEITFSTGNPLKIIRSPCDTCIHTYTNLELNNKIYSEIIRIHFSFSDTRKNSESVKEIYWAKGYGIVQYTACDSAVWNIVFQ